MSSTDTSEPLDGELAAALKRRGAGATPPEPRFADVERRVVRIRRRRRVGGAGAALVVVALVVASLAVARPEGDAVVRTGGTAPSPVVTAPPPTGEPEWATVAGVTPVGAKAPEEHVAGPLPHAPGTGGQAITPYLDVSPGIDTDWILYPLDGDRWTSTETHAQDGPPGDTVVRTNVVAATAFDPSRMRVVPGADVRSRFTAEPEELMADPGARPLATPVERIGRFDWVVLERRCPAAEQCMAAAIGGDAHRLVLVHIWGEDAEGIRPVLATIELRGPAELGRAPEVPAPLPPNVWVNTSVPFFLTTLPTPRDDSVWPAEVPGTYCPAFRTWKDIQMEHLGSFGTAGFVRWLDALAAMAPADLAPRLAVVADEARAGRDVSVDEPGKTALFSVVPDSDARCP